MSAPPWLTDVPEGQALVAVLLPSLLVAYVAGNALVDGDRRKGGLVLAGAGLVAAAAVIAGAVACDGDKRGLCAFSRSTDELMRP